MLQTMSPEDAYDAVPFIKTQFGNLIDPEFLIYIIQQLMTMEPEDDDMTVTEETIMHVIEICEAALYADMAPWPGPGGPPGLN